MKYHQDLFLVHFFERVGVKVFKCRTIISGQNRYFEEVTATLEGMHVSIVAIDYYKKVINSILTLSQGKLDMRRACEQEEFNITVCNMLAHHNRGGREWASHRNGLYGGKPGFQA